MKITPMSCTGEKCPFGFGRVLKCTNHDCEFRVVPKPTNFDVITQNVDSFCDWVFESYKNSPENVPCMVENCETTNRMDCKECFKKWLLQESEE